jgi:tetratricopeptide (TPR) repeat protein
MAISLAVTLILIDLFYKRNVFSRQVIFEKVPFFLLAIAFGVVAIVAQKTSWGQELSQVHYSFVERVLFGGYAFIMYFVKTIFPFWMSGFYPYPECSGGIVFLFIVCALIATATFAMAIYYSRKFPQVVFGFLFYCINIFLLLKIFEVPAGDYIMADRYGYIPSVGLLMMAGVGLEKLSEKKQIFRNAGFIILIIYTLIIGLQTFTRVSIWKDDVTFYSDIISKFPKAEVAYTNRGAIRKENKELTGALSDFNKAIQLGKKDYKSYSNRGAAYLDLGEYKSAVADYRQALTFKPNHPQILADYGFAQMHAGDLNGAIESYDRSLSLMVFNPEVYVNRGTVKYHMGNISGAISDYEIAISQKPEFANAYFDRGLAHIMMNDLNSAISDFTITLNIEPGHVEAWSNMGIAWSRLNNSMKALECYSEAIRLKPAYFEAWLNRGIDNYHLGDFTRAKNDLDEAIRLNPTLAPAYYFRALVALEVKGNSACEDLRKASELGFGQATELLKLTCH